MSDGEAMQGGLWRFLAHGTKAQSKAVEAVPASKGKREGISWEYRNIHIKMLNMTELNHFLKNV